MGVAFNNIKILGVNLQWNPCQQTNRPPRELFSLDHLHVWKSTTGDDQRYQQMQNAIGILHDIGKWWLISRELARAALFRSSISFIVYDFWDLSTVRTDLLRWTRRMGGSDKTAVNTQWGLTSWDGPEGWAAVTRQRSIHSEDWPLEVDQKDGWQPQWQDSGQPTVRTDLLRWTRRMGGSDKTVVNTQWGLTSWGGPEGWVAAAVTRQRSTHSEDWPLEMDQKDGRQWQDSGQHTVRTDLLRWTRRMGGSDKTAVNTQWGLTSWVGPEGWAAVTRQRSTHSEDWPLEVDQKDGRQWQDSGRHTVRTDLLRWTRRMGGSDKTVVNTQRGLTSWDGPEGWAAVTIQRSTHSEDWPLEMDQKDGWQWQDSGQHTMRTDLLRWTRRMGGSHKTAVNTQWGLTSWDGPEEWVAVTRQRSTQWGLTSWGGPEGWAAAAVTRQRSTQSEDWPLEMDQKDGRQWQDSGQYSEDWPLEMDQKDGRQWQDSGQHTVRTDLLSWTRRMGGSDKTAVNTQWGLTSWGGPEGWVAVTIQRSTHSEDWPLEMNQKDGWQSQDSGQHTVRTDLLRWTRRMGGSDKTAVNTQWGLTSWDGPEGWVAVTRQRSIHSEDWPLEMDQKDGRQWQDSGQHTVRTDLLRWTRRMGGSDKTAVNTQWGLTSWDGPEEWVAVTRQWSTHCEDYPLEVDQKNGWQWQDSGQHTVRTDLLRWTRRMGGSDKTAVNTQWGLTSWDGPEGWVAVTRQRSIHSEDWPLEMDQKDGWQWQDSGQHTVRIILLRWTRRMGGSDKTAVNTQWGLTSWDGPEEWVAVTRQRSIHSEDWPLEMDQKDGWQWQDSGQHTVRIILLRWTRRMGGSDKTAVNTQWGLTSWDGPEEWVAVTRQRSTQWGLTSWGGPEGWAAAAVTRQRSTQSEDWPLEMDQKDGRQWQDSGQYSEDWPLEMDQKDGRQWQDSGQHTVRTDLLSWTRRMGGSDKTAVNTQWGLTSWGGPEGWVAVTIQRSTHSEDWPLEMNQKDGWQSQDSGQHTVRTDLLRWTRRMGGSDKTAVNTQWGLTSWDGPEGWVAVTRQRSIHSEDWPLEMDQKDGRQWQDSGQHTVRTDLLRWTRRMGGSDKTAVNTQWGLTSWDGPEEWVAVTRQWSTHCEDYPLEVDQKNGWQWQDSGQHTVRTDLLRWTRRMGGSDKTAVNTQWGLTSWDGPEGWVAVTRQRSIHSEDWPLEMDQKDGWQWQDSGQHTVRIILLRWTRRMGGSDKTAVNTQWGLTSWDGPEEWVAVTRQRSIHSEGWPLEMDQKDGWQWQDSGQHTVRIILLRWTRRMGGSDKTAVNTQWGLTSWDGPEEWVAVTRQRSTHSEDWPLEVNQKNGWQWQDSGQHTGLTSWGGPEGWVAVTRQWSTHSEDWPLEMDQKDGRQWQDSGQHTVRTDLLRWTRRMGGSDKTAVNTQWGLTSWDGPEGWAAVTRQRSIHSEDWPLEVDQKDGWQPQWQDSGQPTVRTDLLRWTRRMGGSDKTVVNTQWGLTSWGGPEGWVAAAVTRQRSTHSEDWPLEMDQKDGRQWQDSGQHTVRTDLLRWTRRMGGSDKTAVNTQWGLTSWVGPEGWAAVTRQRSTHSEDWPLEVDQKDGRQWQDSGRHTVRTDLLRWTRRMGGSDKTVVNTQRGLTSWDGPEGWAAVTIQRSTHSEDWPLEMDQKDGWQWQDSGQHTMRTDLLRWTRRMGGSHKTAVNTQWGLTSWDGPEEWVAVTRQRSTQWGLTSWGGPEGWAAAAVTRQRSTQSEDWPLEMDQKDGRQWQDSGQYSEDWPLEMDQKDGRQWQDSGQHTVRTDLLSWTRRMGGSDKTAVNTQWGLTSWGGPEGWVAVTIQRSTHSEDWPLEMNQKDGWQSQDSGQHTVRTDLLRWTRRMGGSDKTAVNTQWGLTSWDGPEGWVAVTRQRSIHSEDWPLEMDQKDGRQWQDSGQHTVRTDLLRWTRRMGGSDKTAVNTQWGLTSWDGPEEWVAVTRQWSTHCEDYPLEVDQKSGWQWQDSGQHTVRTDLLRWTRRMGGSDKTAVNTQWGLTSWDGPEGWVAVTRQRSIHSEDWPLEMDQKDGWQWQDSGQHTVRIILLRWTRRMGGSDKTAVNTQWGLTSWDGPEEWVAVTRQRSIHSEDWPLEMDQKDGWQWQDSGHHTVRIILLRWTRRMGGSDKTAVNTQWGLTSWDGPEEWVAVTRQRSTHSEDWPLEVNQKNGWQWQDSGQHTGLTSWGGPEGWVAVTRQWSTHSEDWPLEMDQKSGRQWQDSGQHTVRTDHLRWTRRMGGSDKTVVNTQWGLTSWDGPEGWAAVTRQRSTHSEDWPLEMDQKDGRQWQDSGQHTVRTDLLRCTRRMGGSDKTAVNTQWGLTSWDVPEGWVAVTRQWSTHSEDWPLEVDQKDGRQWQDSGQHTVRTDLLRWTRRMGGSDKTVVNTQWGLTSWGGPEGWAAVTRQWSTHSEDWPLEMDQKDGWQWQDSGQHTVRTDLLRWTRRMGGSHKTAVNTQWGLTSWGGPEGWVAVTRQWSTHSEDWPLEVDQKDGRQSQDSGQHTVRTDLLRWTRRMGGSHKTAVNTQWGLTSWDGPEGWAAVTRQRSTHSEDWPLEVDQKDGR